MTKKEKARDEIANCFAAYLGKLHLSEYAFTVYLPDDEDYKEPPDSFMVKVEYPYKQIHIYVSEDLLRSRMKNEETSWRKILLHEAIHCLLWNYTYLAESRYVTQDQLQNMEETTVDHLTEVLYPLMK